MNIKKSADNVVLEEGLSVFLATSEGPIRGFTIIGESGKLFNGEKVAVTYDVPDIDVGIGLKRERTFWPIDRIYIDETLASMHRFC